MSKTVYLLGAGFSKAILNEKICLTNEIFHKLDISNFPEIHDDFNKHYPDIEQFFTAIDLICVKYQQINKSLHARYTEIRKGLLEQVIDLFKQPEQKISNLDDFILLKNFISSIKNNLQF